MTKNIPPTQERDNRTTDSFPDRARLKMEAINRIPYNTLSPQVVVSPPPREGGAEPYSGRLLGVLGFLEKKAQVEGEDEPSG